jgi:UDP-N-acetylglucosamine 2-epimerase (non-hydrolysing)
MKVKPDVLVVHGDTNTTLGGALSAKKLHIKIAHVEAGLRSFDYRMPEEINRILTDRISDVLFAPTKTAADNLLKEGIDEKTVNITGNTIVDALNDHIKIARKKDYLKDFELKKNDYIIATCHRPENVDDPNRLKKLSSILQHATGVVGKKMILPLHPRTKNQLDKNGIELHESIIVKPPVGYLQMLALLDAASLVITDSGGIQEEAYLLKRPLITIRNSTERPETLSANFIIDLDKGKFDEAWDKFEKKKVTWDNSFGDGKASGRIVNALNKVVKD